MGIMSFFSNDIVTAAISENGVKAVKAYTEIANESPNGFVTLSAILMFLFIVLPLTWGMIVIGLRKGFRGQQDFLSSNVIESSNMQMTVLNEVLSLIKRYENKVDSVLFGMNRAITFEQLSLILEEKLQRNKLELFIAAKDMRENEHIQRDEEKLRSKLSEHVSRMKSDSIYLLDKFTCDDINSRTSQIIADTYNEVSIHKIFAEYIFNPKEKDIYIFDNMNCMNDDIIKKLDKYRKQKTE